MTSVPLSRETAIQAQVDRLRAMAVNNRHRHNFAMEHTYSEVADSLAYLLAENEKLRACIDKAHTHLLTAVQTAWGDNPQLREQLTFEAMDMLAALTNEGDKTA